MLNKVDDNQGQIGSVSPNSRNNSQSSLKLDLLENNKNDLIISNDDKTGISNSLFNSDVSLNFQSNLPDLFEFVRFGERLVDWLANPYDRNCSDRSGFLTLNEMWELTNQNQSRLTKAAARCCPHQNRNPDFVPYDYNRVCLSSLPSSDYINASFIEFGIQLKNIWTPRYVIGQYPMKNTIGEFWTMVYEQSVEVIVWLLSPTDTQSNWLHLCLPQDYPGSKLLIIGTQFEVRMQSITKRSNWIERVMVLQNLSNHITRSLVHFTYEQSIPSFISDKSDETGEEDKNLFEFFDTVHSYFKQQRNPSRPLCVLCELGAGPCGMFVLASISLLQLECNEFSFRNESKELFALARPLHQQRFEALKNPTYLFESARLLGQAVLKLAAKYNVQISQPNDMVMKVDSSKESKTLLDNLFDNSALKFDQLLDVVGVDYNSTSNDYLNNVNKINPNNDNEVIKKNHYYLLLIIDLSSLLV